MKCMFDRLRAHGELEGSVLNFVSLPFCLIPEAGCGQRPHNVFLLLMPDWYAEKSKYMYKHKQTGNTIIKEEIRQHKTNTIRQQMSTYLILIKKDFYP